MCSVNELMENEQTHVTFLRTALASAAVDQPAIDIGPAFAAAANAAAGEYWPQASAAWPLGCRL